MARLVAISQHPMWYAATEMGYPLTITADAESATMASVRVGSQERSGE